MRLWSVLFIVPSVLCCNHLWAQDMDYANEVIATLCSDVLAGRGYVDDGDSEAAFYIERQFKAMDLTAWDYNYYQSFFVAVNTFPEKVTLELDGKALTPGKDFIIAPASPSTKGEHPITYLNRLPKLSPSGRLADSTLSFTGAIVVPDSLVRSLPPPIHHALLQGLRKAGASALVRISDQKLTWHVSAQQNALPEVIIHHDAFDATAKRVRLGIEARLIKKHRTQNVMAYIPGTSGSDSTLVFSAHYDHLGKMGKQTIFRGANDNASGMAMLLSLAKHFSIPENAPVHNIAFIAFAAEELGLMGSTHYVEQPVFPLSDIVFLINLDIVGTGEEGVKVVNGAVHEAEFVRLAQLNDNRKYLPTVEKRGKAAISDHYPFSEKGVPCFYIYTLGGSPAYHDVNDLPDGLSLAGFKGLFQLIVDFSQTF